MLLAFDLSPVRTFVAFRYNRAGWMDVSRMMQDYQRGGLVGGFYYCDLRDNCISDENL